ncbi:MAG: LD-carboxypeptidase, partial [Burkholderiales bacterium]|nr:LD-carboxypeptidase [Burkholderiales bacterium]
FNGWFDHLSGILIGRSAAPNVTTNDELNYHEALAAVLADLPYPILIDVDIGHQPPQLTLINGALAEVVFENSAGRLTQWSSPH